MPSKVIWDRPGVTDSSKIVVGDPYIKFTAKDGKDYYTRNFSHSELIPKEKRKRNENSHTYRTSCYNYYIVIHRGDDLCNW